MQKIDTAELRRLHKEGAKSSQSFYVFDSIPALLDELEAAREENERLTDVIFQGEGIDATGELGITRENFREWLRERDKELKAARDEVRSAKAAMRMMDQSIEGLESALGKELGVPEDQAVWKWLLKRDRYTKAIGAAEWLEANNERLDTMNRADVEQEAAKLRQEAENGRND